jgi:hypothetical protein
VAATSRAKAQRRVASVSSDAAASDTRIDPAEVLRGQRPWHRIQNITDQHTVRTCLKFEAESANPRKQVIAKLNERLAELQDAQDADPDDLERPADPPSVDEALSIGQHFTAEEVRAQLRAEREGVIPGVDEPRETVIRALEQRLEEVSR